MPQAESGGQYKTPAWRLIGASIDESDGQKLTLRLACGDPALEATSVWHARKGRGPIDHRLSIKNTSGQSVTIGEQPTFDLDLAGAATLWSFHSDGGTPDAVGVYRQPVAELEPGRRWRVRTAPNGEFIPYVVLESDEGHGVYVGVEWSTCRIEALPISISGAPTKSLRLRGSGSPPRTTLAPGETFETPPGFLGAYRGDLDDAGNSLRRWLMRYRVPEVLRQDASYPKVQWNAFGATGKTPGSWDPVESKFYPLIDDIAPLGFEEVMIDVGWWAGDEPDSDPVDWPSGMGKAADYAHEHGMRFGLYWTDPLDMADAAARRRRAERITRLFSEYRADMWRSDCTRGEVVGASYAATRGFYEMVDGLARDVPGFQWENCCGGGRIKDYGAMARAVKIFNSDTYSALHVRQGFYDTSFAFHQAQIEGHLGSVDGRFRPRGAAGMRYAFRSVSMGAPEWFLDAPNGGNGCEPWTQEEKDTVRACVETYKTRIRPLVRGADLYHIFPRPDGQNWDGLEYYDPAAGKGVVYLFKPAAEPAAATVRFRGLDAAKTYRLTFDDGSNPASEQPGATLMGEGIPVKLEGAEVSELLFFEQVR